MVERLSVVAELQASARAMEALAVALPADAMARNMAVLQVRASAGAWIMAATWPDEQLVAAVAEAAAAWLPYVPATAGQQKKPFAKRPLNAIVSAEEYACLPAEAVFAAATAWAARLLPAEVRAPAGRPEAPHFQALAALGDATRLRNGAAVCRILATVLESGCSHQATEELSPMMSLAEASRRLGVTWELVSRVYKPIRRTRQRYQFQMAQFDQAQRLLLLGIVKRQDVAAVSKNSGPLPGKARATGRH